MSKEEKINRSPSKNEVIQALHNVGKTVEGGAEAARILSNFLAQIDTSTMSRTQRLKIQGVLNGCRKIDAEITNPERYIRFLEENIQ